MSKIKVKYSDAFETAKGWTYDLCVLELQGCIDIIEGRMPRAIGFADDFYDVWRKALEDVLVFKPKPEPDICEIIEREAA